MLSFNRTVNIHPLSLIIGHSYYFLHPSRNHMKQPTRERESGSSRDGVLANRASLPRHLPQSLTTIPLATTRDLATTTDTYTDTESTLTSLCGRARRVSRKCGPFWGLRVTKRRVVDHQAWVKIAKKGTKKGGKEKFTHNATRWFPVAVAR